MVYKIRTKYIVYSYFYFYLCLGGCFKVNYELKFMYYLVQVLVELLLVASVKYKE